MTPKLKNLLIAGAITLAILSAALAGTLLLRSGDTTPMSEPSEPSVTASPPELQEPTADDLVRLQDDLGSGKASQIAPYLGAETEDIDPDFVNSVAGLGIAFETMVVESVAEGLYEVTAHDKGGNTWRIGLRFEGEQLILAYAEPA